MCNLSWLAGRLTPTSARMLEAAVRVSEGKQHYFMGVEHIVWALTESASSEVQQALVGSGVSLAELRASLNEQMNVHFRRDWKQEIRVTPRAARILKEAWDEARRDGKEQISPTHVLRAVLQEGNSAPVRILETKGVDPKAVLRRLRDTPTPPERALMLPQALQDLCYDLTALAEENKLPAVLGREEEIQQLLGTLLIREGPANPLLTGPAGVGKSAIVEGLAQRLVGDPKSVPDRLRGCRLIALSTNALLAQHVLVRHSKMKQVIDFIIEHRDRAILTVDEFHGVIQAGLVSALLAPLARAQLRLIGVTTTAYYNEFIRRNDALYRRFRQIQVDEPPREIVEAILRSVQKRYEQQYGMRILDDSVAKAVELSPRYVRSLKTPHKAKQWLALAVTKAELDARETVTPDDVIQVVSEQARIPVDLIQRTPLRLEQTQDVLQQRVICQDHVLSQLQEWLLGKLGPVPQRKPTAPNGVFLLLGPTGAGKTETAKALAEFLFGDETRMIRLDMSEYQDNLAYIRLIGHGRGIVGAEQGGLLTESIKDTPYTLLLLDEIEKAHPATLQLFLQIFDEGWVTSGLGETVYFSDATIIMTSNLGQEIYHSAENPELPPPEEEQEQVESPDHEDPRPVDIRMNLPRGREETRQAIIDHIEKNNLLAPELLNRVDVKLVFDPLSRGCMDAIVRLLARKLNERISCDGKELILEQAAVDLIAEVGYSPRYNARELDRAFTISVENKLNACYAEGTRFRVRVEGDEIIVDPLQAPTRQ